jgi:hypothetical protein
MIKANFCEILLIYSFLFIVLLNNDSLTFMMEVMKIVRKSFRTIII